MNRLNLRRACLFSSVIVIGCSGERPSFPNGDASVGSNSTQAPSPDAGLDGGASESSGSVDGTASESTQQGNTASTSVQELDSSTPGPVSVEADATNTSIAPEPTDASTNDEPDSSLDESDTSDSSDEAPDGSEIGNDATDDEATDDDASDESSNTSDAAATSDDSMSSTSDDDTSNADCVPTERDCSSSEDNDCDGEPDNQLDDVCKCEPGDERECQTHPNLDGEGICRSGSQTCVLLETGSDWDDCEGSVGPADELCTGNVDEDCDGEINESDACPCADDPCENGGSCEATGGGYTCDCSETGFAGDNCDEPLAIVLPRGPGNSDCGAVTLSGDGSVVGATCDDRPAYWSASTGWQYLTAPNGYFRGELVDMSSNGQVFVASMVADGTSNTRAVRWASRNATGSLLGGGTGSTSVTGVSADGQRTLGYDSDGAVLVWTGAAAATPYPAPTGANVRNSAVNGDGSIVWSSNLSDGTVLLRWAGATSPTEFPEADVFSLNVSGVSEDGQVVVGTGNPSSSSLAVWRFIDDQLTWLNSGGAVLCYSYGSVSSDGSRVAGNCLKPVVWIGDAQLDIQTYLTPIVDDLDASIDQATTAMRSVSADGKYAVGDDFTRVFRVRLPNP